MGLPFHPWPGIVYRLKSGETQHQIGANVNSSIKVETNLETNITKVNIKRTNGVIYLKLNDGEYDEVLDMSALNTTFYVPLTIGASLKANGTPQRQFTGKLSNIVATVY